MPKLIIEDLAQLHWSTKERGNAEIITDFVQNLMNEHNFNYIRAIYSNNRYKQHNPIINEEVKGIILYVKNMVRKFPKYSYDVKEITASGDIVILHSHVTLHSKQNNNKTKKLVIMDKWRLQNNIILEHWSSIQPLNCFFKFYMLLVVNRIRNLVTIQ